MRCEVGSGHTSPTRSVLPNPRSLSDTVALPCGAVLKNRIAKSAMSDSLGDGRGYPSDAQIALYKVWAEGGAALSLVGEVQGDPSKAEKPGNLVLRPERTDPRFEALARAGTHKGSQLWLQLGNAGAMAYRPIGTPKGPSNLDLDGLSCAALTTHEISALPDQFAGTARLAQDLGFCGVELHAAHGFLLSQFLSPLFNKRGDAYGGSLRNRLRLTLEVAEAVRDAVGPRFPIGIKLNATDQLAGGFTQDEALLVVEALEKTSLDLIDISGGTYFPGAPSASDGAGSGPYFLEFAKKARCLTGKPLMLTGGFKTLKQAQNAIDLDIDFVGLARALILDPNLPNTWLGGGRQSPVFPRFDNPPEGGVTAWYTMRLTDLAEGNAVWGPESLIDDVKAYEARDAARVKLWNETFH
ncbi:MAG: oxidoreductase [Pseudomonadota bacterium]